MVIDHGAAALCFYENEILLVQINYGPYKGHWILPGGTVDPKEQPHDAAIREVKEETNLDVKIQHLANVRHRIKENGETNTYWVFKAEILTKNPHQNLKWAPEEIIDVKFWNVEEAIKHKIVRSQTKYYIESTLRPDKFQKISQLNGPHYDFSYLI